MADELNFDLAFGEIKEDAPQMDNYYEYGAGDGDGGEAGDGDGGDDRGSFYVANDWVEDEPVEPEPEPEQDEGFELPLRAYADRALNDSTTCDTYSPQYSDSARTPMKRKGSADPGAPVRSPSPRTGDSSVGGEEEN